MVKLKEPFEVPTKDAPQLPFTLFDQYQPHVFNYLRSRCQYDDAEDLLSQARLSFVERLPSLRDMGQVQSFIFQITRDLLKKYWKQQARFATSDDIQGESLGSDGEKSYLSKEKQALLKQCIKEIPKDTIRNVAVLRYRQGRPHKDIRNHLQLTPDQVKKYIRKAELSITDCVRRKMRGTLRS